MKRTSVIGSAALGDLPEGIHVIRGYPILVTLDVELMWDSAAEPPKPRVSSISTLCTRLASQEGGTLQAMEGLWASEQNLQTEILASEYFVGLFLETLLKWQHRAIHFQNTTFLL